MHDENVKIKNSGLKNLGTGTKIRLRNRPSRIGISVIVLRLTLIISVIEEQLYNK